jgi:glutaredoxin 2
MKQVLREQMLASTSHGLPNAIRTQHLPIKTMWSISFILSTALCSYLIIQTIMEYLVFDVITKVRIVGETEAEFPRIAICNINPFQTQYAMSIYEKNKKMTLFDFYKMSILLSNEDKKRLSYSINETLISCQFSSISCNWKDFEWIYNIYIGACFVFNSGRNYLGETVPIKKLKQAGRFAGLQLEMFVDLPKPLKKIGPGFAGAILVLGNNSFRNVYEDEQEILVSPGSLTYIAVQRTIVNQMEKPYSECSMSPDSILYERILNLNASYTRADCISLCRQLQIEKECKCYDLYHPRINSNTFCNSTREKDCSRSQTKIFDGSDLSSECNQMCPFECKKVIFSTIHSQINEFSNEKAQEYFEHKLLKSKYEQFNSSLADVKQSIINLNVFYDRLSFTQITEKPSFPFVDLISNVGGTFGLFLGISLLSFLEVVEIIYELLLIFSNKKIIPFNKSVSDSSNARN